MSFRILRPRHALLVCVCAALSFGSFANETLDFDQRELFPGLGATDPATGLPARLRGTGEREFVVLEIENIAGNDPFDEQQPFLNFDGQRLASVAELLAAIDGLDVDDLEDDLEDDNDIDDDDRGGGGGGRDRDGGGRDRDGGGRDRDGGGGGDNRADDRVCDPELVQSTTVPVPDGFGGFLEFAFASINFDPVTGDCRLLRNSNGNLLFFQYPVDDRGSNSIFDLGAEIFLFDLIEIVPVFGNGFTLLTPPDDPRSQLPGIGSFRLGRTTLELRQDATGAVFEIDLDIRQIRGAASAIDVIDFSGIPTQAQSIVEAPVFRVTVRSIEQTR